MWLAALANRSRSSVTSTASTDTPRRLETRAPSRSNNDRSSPRRDCFDRLWWICSASVLLPELIVP